jgi:hypothetical protein
MNLSFRTRMLPWALLTSLAVGLWAQSPGAAAANFSIWFVVVYAAQEIADAIRARSHGDNNERQG